MTTSTTLALSSDTGQATEDEETEEDRQEVENREAASAQQNASPEPLPHVVPVATRQRVRTQDRVEAQLGPLELQILVRKLKLNAAEWRLFVVQVLRDGDVDELAVEEGLTGVEPEKPLGERRDASQLLDVQVETSFIVVVTHSLIDSADLVLITRHQLGGQVQVTLLHVVHRLRNLEVESDAVLFLTQVNVGHLFHVSWLSLLYIGGQIAQLHVRLEKNGGGKRVLLRRGRLYLFSCTACYAQRREL